MSTPINVIVADDHPVFRKGLVHTIGGDSALRLVGEADTGNAVLEMIREKNPDVALLDIAMPGMSGLEVARVVQEGGLSTRVVVLTMYADEETFNAAMDAGVSGYVLKENAIAEILNSVKTVARGEYYISPTMSGYLVERSKRRQAAFNAIPELASLTAAEWRVLKLIGGSRTSKEIAENLSISAKTVENHRASIAAKLRLHGNNAVLKFALEHRALL